MMPSSKVKSESSNNNCNAVGETPKKPTRPLTAYHLFFQLEREYILQTTPPDKDGITRTASPAKDDSRPIGKQIDKDMPYRYRYIHFSPHWYASGSGKRIDGDGKNKPKRKHRKTHGKISFLDLSKCIASRWAELEEQDNVTKQYVHRIATRELDLYKKEMALFKEKKSSSPVVATKQHDITTYSCNPCNSGSFETKSGLTTGMSTLKNNSKHSSKWSVSSYVPKETTCIQIKAGGGGLAGESTRGTSLEESAPAVPKKQSAVSFDLGTKNSVDSPPEFSFHPISSSYWKKYKNNKSSKRRGSGMAPSSRDASFTNKMSSQYAPYSISNSSRRQDRQNSWPSTLSYKHQQDGSNPNGSGGFPGINSYQYATNRDYNTIQMDLENDMESFLSQCEETTNNSTTSSQEHVNMEITSDDAMGLMKALSDDNE